MNTSNTKTRSCSQSGLMSGCGLGRFVPAWLGGSRGIILAAISVIAGGAYLGWPWLVTIGAASVVLSLLPCLLMCALGLCVMGRRRQSRTQQSEAIAPQAPALLARDAEARPSAQPLPASRSETVA